MQGAFSSKRVSSNRPRVSRLARRRVPQPVAALLVVGAIVGEFEWRRIDMRGVLPVGRGIAEAGQEVLDYLIGENGTGARKTLS